MAIQVFALAQSDLDVFESLLRRICTNVRVARRGLGATPRVELLDPAADMSSPGCCCLDELIKSRYTVTIVLIQPPKLVRMNGPQITDGGGGFIQSGPNATVRDLGSAGLGDDSTIVFDISDNNSNGYFVMDATGKAINFPSFLRLTHLLCTGYAYNNARGTTALVPAVRFQQALDHENEIRRMTNAPNGRPYAERSGDFAGAVPGTVGGVAVPTRPPDN